ncbi:MAG TPA: NUDIX domain-containing protein [Micromonosporaceae bacterium]|nr:NUDIX domain-containing protein [Micromonosporaceae bacterium]
MQMAAVDVFLILLRAQGREALFGLRGAGVYAPHTWNLPSGKIDEGEDAVSAVIREAVEETGIQLIPEDLTPVGAIHARNQEGMARVGFVFAADHDVVRHGEPVNAEPVKCDGLAWHDLTVPPQPLEPYNHAAIELYLRGNHVALHGWEHSAATG